MACTLDGDGRAEMQKGIIGPGFIRCLYCLVFAVLMWPLFTPKKTSLMLAADDPTREQSAQKVVEKMKLQVS